MPVPPFPRDIIFHILRSCHQFPTCSPETSSWLTGLYCLSPKAMPMADHGGEPTLIDAVISKQQKPHLQEPGWFFCFNEANVASMFVCACLQSDSDLSHAESRFRGLLEKHINPPTPGDRCWGPARYPHSESFRAKLAQLPNARNFVADSWSLFSPWMPFPNLVVDTSCLKEMQANTLPSVKCSVCLLLSWKKLDNNHSLIQSPHFRH